MQLLALFAFCLALSTREAARSKFQQTVQLKCTNPQGLSESPQQSDSDLDDDQILARVTPEWIQKAVIFAQILPCLLEEVTSLQVPALHEIWSLDYKWNLLGFEDRAALNRSLPATDANATGLEATYAWLRKVVSEHVNHANAIFYGDSGLVGERLTNLISAFEEWVHSAGDENYNYEEARDACLAREQHYVDGLSRKLRSELVGPCEGEANRFGGTCATKTTCPEGTECGVVAQRRGTMTTLATFALANLGIFSGLGLAVGFSTAALLPGQTEGALALTMFATSYDHQCVCKPLGCAWSDIHKACVTDALATGSSQQLGLDLKMLPLTGFKCMKIEETCQLQGCNDADFRNMGSGSDGLTGKIGMHGPNSFNCWSSGSRKNVDMSSGERLQVYALEKQRGNSVNWFKAPV